MGPHRIREIKAAASEAVTQGAAPPAAILPVM